MGYLMEQDKRTLIVANTSVFRSELSRQIALFTATVKPIVPTVVNKESKGPVNRKNHWER